MLRIGDKGIARSPAHPKPLVVEVVGEWRTRRDVRTIVTHSNHFRLYFRQHRGKWVEIKKTSNRWSNAHKREAYILTPMET
jgi:hypothetical protein